MPDNVPINGGAGYDIATDLISGVHYQRNKVSVGADGEAADLDFGQAAMAASLPVVIASDQTPIPTAARAVPTTLATHRTFTAYVGESDLAPAADNALWEENPGGYNTARVYVNVVVTDATGTGTTGLAEQSIWLRNGTTVFQAAEVIAASSDPYAYYLYQGAYCQKTTNDGVAYTDYELFGEGSAVILDALDTKANGDWFIVGAYKPFVSVSFVATIANAETSTLSAEYWDGDSWTAIVFTDLTENTGATLGQNGDCLLFKSLAADWAASTINGIAAYWVRFSVSAPLSASVTLTAVVCHFPIQTMRDVVVGGDDLLVGFKNESYLITGTYKIAWR